MTRIRMKQALLAAVTCIAATLALAQPKPVTAEKPNPEQDSAPSGSRTYGSLRFAPCNLAASDAPVDVDAFCTTLRVPENPAAPTGRKIELALAWVPSSHAKPAPEPVFMLAGGPGQSARDSYPGIASAFREIRKRRHVLLLDQRGTGASNPMVCRDRDGKPAVLDDDDTSTEALRGFTERCRDSLAGRADPRFYTTSVAVQDLDLVRERLGVERVGLVGISYGTRVAQQYLARYPDRVYAAVLDGVAPNSMALGIDHARNLESSLDLQFARCKADKACSTRFGNPRANLDRLLAEARVAPRTVAFRDPSSNEWREQELTPGVIAGLVRLFAYAPGLAASLPMTLHEAVNGRAGPLMAQAEMITASLSDQISHGMQLSVICSEDADLLRVNSDDADTVLGNSLIELMQAQCDVWPRGSRPENFHSPLVSNRPVLLLSGEFDPVTPPRYGNDVLRTLSNARHLVLRGQGHNVIGAGCMPRLLAEYFEKPEPAALEVDCLKQLDYAPQFTGFYGWEP